jgi:hypothetical protein
MAAANQQQIVNNNEQNIQTIYISPNVIHRMFNYVLAYEPFEYICIRQNVCEQMLNQQFQMSNQEYIWQLYIRYLCCTGHINTLFNMLRYIENYYIQENNNININLFELFLNRNDVPGFENITILDMFILWNNNDNFIMRLRNLHATTHITQQNIINFIHQNIWSNPFQNILQIPGFPSFHRNNIVQLPEINALIANGNQINIQIRLQRHISHFHNSVIGVIRDYQINNNQEQEILNELIINNPELNNEHIQNNNIVMAI